MNYTELKTQIENYLNRSDLTNVLDDFIKHTEAEVNRKLRHKDMMKRVTAVADTQYVQLPGDWLGAVNIDIQNTNPTVNLKQLSLESMDDYRTANDDPTGQPKYFAVESWQTKIKNPDIDKIITLVIDLFLRKFIILIKF